MKSRLLPINFWSFAVYSLFFVFVFLRLFYSYNFFNDDLYFYSHAQEDVWTELLFSRYQNWSSRIIVEFFALCAMKIPLLIWEMLYAVFFVFNILAVSYLVGAKELKQKIMVGILLCTVPATFISEAGWVITSVSYVFPLYLGIYGTCSLRDVAEDKNISLGKMVSYVLAVLIAANMEQYCAILTIIFVVALGYYFVIKKRIIPVFMAQIVAIMADIVLFLCSPGNKIRYQMEMNNILPEYETWSFFYKMYKGTTHLLEYVILDGYLLSLLLLSAVFLWVIVYQQKKHILMWFGLLFLAVAVAWILKFKYTYRFLWWADNRLSFEYLFVLFIFLFIVTMLFMIYKNTLGFYEKMLIFGVGILAVVLVGLSPTVFVVGRRVFISLIYVTIVWLASIYVEYDKKVPMLKSLLMMFFIYQLLNYFIN